jgi:glycosyltransferase involved in cell wall biosynthesis
MAATVYLNGKYCAQPITGVQRVAAAMVQQLDGLVQPGERWVLLCPPGAVVPPLSRIEARRSRLKALPLTLWEQLWLPLLARDGVLVNFCGAAPFWGRRQVCMLHDAAVFDRPQAYRRTFVWWYRLLFRRLARSNARLVTVSEFSRDRLAQALNVSLARIDVIANGADHLSQVQADAHALERFGLAGKTFALTVGSAQFNKNRARLLQAWRNVTKPADARLVVVGAGHAQVFVSRDKAEPSPDIVWIETASDAELKALYQGAQLFVLPSVYEGFGLPAVEAMNCDCPVAASNAAALPEVCADAALYFDAEREESIAEALHTLLQNAALREQLKAAGRGRAARFRWADAAAQLRERAMEAARA